MTMKEKWAYVMQYMESHPELLLDAIPSGSKEVYSSFLQKQ